MREVQKIGWIFAPYEIKIELSNRTLSQSQNIAYRYLMGLGKKLAQVDKQNVGFFARLQTRLACWLGNHEPNRAKVRRTIGVNYVGVCRNCGITIGKRHGHPWKAVSPDEVSRTRNNQSATDEPDGSD